MTVHRDRVVEKARERASYFAEHLDGSTVAVAGAGGYLGAGIVRAVEAVAEATGARVNVIALAREGEPVRAGSPQTAVMDYPAYEALHPEVDFGVNTIGMTGDFRSRVLDTAEAHICALTRLLRAASYTQGFVTVSSTRVYPFTADESLVWSEDSEILTPHLTLDAVYDDSKKLAETICVSMARQGVPCKVVRMSNIVSEDLPLHGALAVSALFGALRERNEVLVNGNAAASKDFCHLADAVDGVLATLTKGRAGEVYNVASGVSASTREVAEWVSAASGAPIVEGPSCVMEPRLYSRISVDKARRELSFSPETNLRAVFESVAHAVLEPRAND